MAMEGKSSSSEINEYTRVSLGLLVMILGLTFWVGVSWAQISELKEKMSTLQRIDQRLSRIEGKLGVNPD